MLSKKWLCATALPLLTATPFCGAAMLIQDNFDRTGALGGTTPDVDVMSSTDTWVAPASYSTDGTEALTTTSAGDSSQYVAAIPFDLAGYAAANPNTLLTLSVTASVNNANSNGSWISLGFLQGVGGLPMDGGVDAAPWMILRADSGTVEFPGPGIDLYPVAITPDGSSTFSSGTLSLTYNTTTNEADYYLDTGSGPILEGSMIYASVPTDQFVGFSTESDNFYGNTYATFSNFTMTEVPEPGSLGLISLTGMALLGRRRRGIKA